MADDTAETPGDSGPEGGKLHEEEAGHETEDDLEDWATERSTAPQSDFSKRQVAVGALVTAVGLVIAYAVPGLVG